MSEKSAFQRAQYGLVARFSSDWHSLRPEGAPRKGNDLRVSPVTAEAVVTMLRYIGPGVSIDFMAYYRDSAERRLLEDALRELGLDLKLPPCASSPIMRSGRGAHCDRVVLVERRGDGSLGYTMVQNPHS